MSPKTLKTLLNIILFPFFVFSLIYAFLYLIKLFIFAVFLYGIFIFWVILDPTFALNKLYYFVGITLFLAATYYFGYIYDEVAIKHRRANPIKEDFKEDFNLK